MTCQGQKWQQIRVRKLRNCQTLSTNPGRPSQKHLQQIGVFSRAGVKVLYNLPEENRDNRTTTYNLLLQPRKTEAFFDRLMTGDEKWVLYDNSKRKRQQWRSPSETPRRIAKLGLHPIKALLRVWQSFCGIVHFEVLKPGQTVNTELYYEQLDRVNQSNLSVQRVSRYSATLYATR